MGSLDLSNLDTNRPFARRTLSALDSVDSSRPPAYDSGQTLMAMKLAETTRLRVDGFYLSKGGGL
jgi:hypothetical protein